MKRSGYMVSLTILCIFAGAVIAAAWTADEILRKMESHTAVSSNFEMTIRVESFRDNELANATVMRGHISNGKMTTLTFLEPANMKNRKIVIKDNEMWMIVPNTKNPIRMTPSQRLLGGLSFADVARASFVENYAPKLNGEEAVSGMNSNGAKTDPVKCFLLELTAKEKKTTYNKVSIWVDERNFLPVKADLFSLSGKKMMTAYYTSPKELEGKIIMTKLYFYDQISPNKYFSMEYSDIQSF